jgi:trk system potassium uptake protein TrkH
MSWGHSVVSFFQGAFQFWGRASWTRRYNTMHLLVAGYCSYVLIGWGLLCLPQCQQSAAHWLDHLFTSASAVSTTGLATVSTSDTYSFAGELVVLVLIQFGGLGYMTISSFVVLAVSGDLSASRKRVSTAALSLPEGFEVAAFLRTICCFTLIVELLGVVALYPSFAARNAPEPLWQAVFHSVSAFCTAGFSLFNNSLEDYRQDVWLNVVVSVLSLLGAIGFIVVHDLWLSIRRRKPQMTLTSKVILLSTKTIIAVGTILFALNEPSLQHLAIGDRWLTAFFQVMSASTTVGFNSIPMGALSSGSVLLIVIVMVIGASPSGTGGGLKTTTFSAVWAEMIGVIRLHPMATFFGKSIPEARMRSAVANVVFYSACLAAGMYLLALVDSHGLVDQAFECASALGTVGLSRGITGTLTPGGKAVLIVLMVVGRIGPVVLAMAFFSRRRHTSTDAPAFPQEDVVV